MTKTPSTNFPYLPVFFALAFLFSWLVWGIAVLASYNVITLPIPNMGFVFIGANGPLVAALSLTFRKDGWKGIKTLLVSGFNLRMRWVWWIFILLLPLLVTGVAVWVNVAQSDFQLDRTVIDQPLMILGTFLAMFFLGGSVQEEFGWRGYALPRLMQKWNPLFSSILLGAIWGLWHLPLFYISGTSQVFMSFGIFFLLAIAFSVLFTWFYMKTNRNLFSALLFHTAINTAMSVFPPIEQISGGNQMAFTFLSIAYVLVAAVVILVNPALWFRTP